MHIVSVIVCYLFIILFFILFMRLATRTRKEQEARAWEKLNPANKPSKIEPLRIGQTYETFQGGSAVRLDPPIPFDQPYHLQEK
jgi:hypothetical protein